MKPHFTLHPFLFTILAFPAFSQPAPTPFSDCDNLESVLFVSDDVLLIRCDTVYVLNKLTFRRYDSAYKDLRRRGTNVANLISAYDEIIALQENRIKEQAQSYSELRENFGRLTAETQAQVGESAARLGQALNSMEALSKDLTETKKLLGEAKEIIEAEKRGLNLEKILWGAGGLIVGLLLGIALN